MGEFARRGTSTNSFSNSSCLDLQQAHLMSVLVADLLRPHLQGPGVVAVAPSDKEDHSRCKDHHSFKGWRYQFRRHVEILHRRLSRNQSWPRSCIGDVPTLHRLCVHAPYLGQVRPRLMKYYCISKILK